MKDLICIVCPRGCRLTVDEENGCAVTGNACPRGEQYGKNEILNPVRTLTTTVRIESAVHALCPVRTKEAIPKKLLFEAMKELNAVRLTAPVAAGDVAYKNILNTGIDVIVTRNIDR